MPLRASRRGADRCRAVAHWPERTLNSEGAGAVFNPKVQRHDGRAFEVLTTTCPLKQAWQDYGLDDEEAAKVCDNGSTIDYGKFEGAGFRFECDTWVAGGAAAGR